MKLELKPDRAYDRIHAWIRKKYGKANLCESKECKGESKSYHWALKKGFEYSKNRDAFFMLCQSCHKIYDTTKETKKKMSDSKRGENHPRAKLVEKQVEEIKSKYSFRKYTQKMLAKEYGVCEHTIHYILKERTWKTN